MKDAPFLMVSGFHRSGTSLVAQTLQSNGVDMGSQLMGASFGNPNGHVEDIPLVTLHDQMLNANGQDWRCTLTQELHTPKCFETRQQAYVTSRQTNRTSAYIGAKDPRALHFLQSWKKHFQSDIAFIIVFRDWRFSVSSLLKRHSRELLNTLGTFNSRPIDFEFWQQPNLAAKMWLASAKLTVAHFKASPENTLLLPLEALVQSNDTLFKNASRIGIAPSLFNTHSVVSPELLQSNIPSSALGMLDTSLIEECDLLQNTLYELGGYKAPLQEHPLTHSSNLVEKLLHQISAPAVNTKRSISKLDINDYTVAEALELYNFLKEDVKPYFPWNELVDRNNLSNSDYQAIFEVTQKCRLLDIAEIVMQRAINVSPAPWRWMQLGDVYLLKKMPFDARKCYLNAQKASPTNATFLAKLADVHIFEGNYLEAASLIEQAKQLDPSKPAIAHSEKRLAQASRKTSNSEINNSQLLPIITDYTSVVNAMTDDKAKGLALDEYLVKSMFVTRNTRKWLIDGLSLLPQTSQRCLADYLCQHLQRYWNTTVLETELLDSASSNNVGPVSATFSCNKNAKVGVHIHVYYAHLLPEIMSFLNDLPVPIKLVVTCTADNEKAVSELLPAEAILVVCENRGRDIAPWLIAASPHLQSCDIALKLHTKSSPHADKLYGWRLQLLWALIGSKGIIENNLSMFYRDPTLGVLHAPHHPKLKNDINWGSNRDIALALSSKMNIEIPITIANFPAGSMFWYRPSALAILTRCEWTIDEFPLEAGQIDGTVMHAIERLINVVAGSDNITSLLPTFENALPFKHS